MTNQSHYSQNVPGQYTPPKPPLPPVKKMPWWAWLLVAFFGIPSVLGGALIAFVASTSPGDLAPAISSPSAPVDTYDPGIQTPPTKAAVPSPKVTHKPAPTTTTKTTAPPKRATVSQEQAIGAAEDYLTYQSFSRTGLIKQLSSTYGEGFSKADATYAVDHVEVDWNEQAVKSAREYLDGQHFSRAGLIHQLEFEGFTHAQAIHGVKAAGL